MSYDPEYNEWVEKLLAKRGREFHNVYREIPVIRIKTGDDPPQYRYRAPVVRGGIDEYDVLCNKIDEQLDKPEGSMVVESRKKGSKLDEDETEYFHKWQDCQVELEDMKRREAKTLAELEKLRGRVEEISSARMQLEKEVNILKSQVKEYEKIVEDLENKE